MALHQRRTSTPGAAVATTTWSATTESSHPTRPGGEQSCSAPRKQKHAVLAP